MPTVLLAAGYRFFFYSLERGEPPHVHVVQGEKTAKYWLERVELARSDGFRSHELGRVRELVFTASSFEGGGMSTSAPVSIDPDPTVIDVEINDSALRIVLSDGRELSAPLAWFPRLRDASPERRRNWEPIGRGHGVHWPDLDEDVSVRTLMGHPS